MIRYPVLRLMILDLIAVFLLVNFNFHPPLLPLTPPIASLIFFIMVILIIINNCFYFFKRPHIKLNLTDLILTLVHLLHAVLLTYIGIIGLLFF